MRRRESELHSTRARGEPIGKRYTLGELIKWYGKEIGKTADWGRSKEADLKRRENYEIAKRPAPSLTVADYLQHAYTRAEEGAGPATIGNDLIWIGQVLRSAHPSLGASANLEVLNDARHELRTSKLLAKSRHRDKARRLGTQSSRRALLMCEFIDDSAPGLATRKERSWSATTAGHIVGVIAGEHGLTPRVPDALTNQPVSQLDQTESNMALLRRMGKHWDAVATIKHGYLMFAPIGHGKTAGGTTPPTLTLQRRSGDRHHFQEIDRSACTGVRARWYDMHGARGHLALAGKDGM